MTSVLLLTLSGGGLHQVRLITKEIANKGEGVKKSNNLADVICTWPKTRWITVVSKGSFLCPSSLISS